MTAIERKVSVERRGEKVKMRKRPMAVDLQ